MNIILIEAHSNAEWAFLCLSDYGIAQVLTVDDKVFIAKIKKLFQIPYFDFSVDKINVTT
ncbi:hypothetical protein BCU90_23855 [Vibrio lentus]|uniref:Uncharacterized protein n=1 Tax=Vibrio tasmaniensis 1F-267 TaxID=1191324 RepID=A0ABX3B6D9_9VIBR|nr:hypothetical protein A163_06130 [Vibrio tasmaniensis 1F-267]PMG43559.1 hypothetical protein BCU90_23855 [Vibrio lentus]